MVAHTCTRNSGEVETGKLPGPLPSQPGLLHDVQARESLSQSTVLVAPEEEGLLRLSSGLPATLTHMHTAPPIPHTSTVLNT